MGSRCKSLSSAHAGDRTCAGVLILEANSGFGAALSSRSRDVIHTADFRIAGVRRHRVPRLIYLFESELPGLTAALAREHGSSLIEES